ncbi:hypothetical protein J7L36_00155 [bacterium]|nr:hypothetical protein [bacterium]
MYVVLVDVRKGTNKYSFHFVLDSYEKLLEVHKNISAYIGMEWEVEIQIFEGKLIERKIYKGGEEK